MKPICMVVSQALIVLLFSQARGAYSQGSGPPAVSFSNEGLRPDAPVFDLDGVTRLSGSTFVARLYAGPPGSPDAALVQLGTARPFYSGDRAGYWIGAGIDVSSQAVNRTFVVQGSFEAAKAGGLPYGVSNVLALRDFGGTQPPPAMDGMQSFALVPEPSVVVLGGLGTFFLLAWRRSWR